MNYVLGGSMTSCNMVLWVEGLAGNQEFWIPVSAQIVALPMVMGSYSSEREANIPFEMEMRDLNIP